MDCYKFNMFNMTAITEKPFTPLRFAPLRDTALRHRNPGGHDETEYERAAGIRPRRPAHTNPRTLN